MLVEAASAPVAVDHLVLLEKRTIPVGIELAAGLLLLLGGAATTVDRFGWFMIVPSILAGYALLLTTGLWPPTRTRIEWRAWASAYVKHAARERESFVLCYLDLDVAQPRDVTFEIVMENLLEMLPTTQAWQSLRRVGATAWTIVLADAREADELMTRVRRELRSSAHPADGGTHVTAGWAVYPDDGDTAARLLKRARRRRR